MGTPFKMKGHTLPGINQKASPAKEGTFEQKKKAINTDEKYKSDPGYQAYLDKTMGGKTTVKDGVSSTVKSPSKWVQFIPAAISAVSAMTKKKEE